MQYYRAVFVVFPRPQYPCYPAFDATVLQKNGCNRNRLLLGRYNELLKSCVLGDTARDVFRARQITAGVDVEQFAIERADLVEVFGLE